jgi:transcriptional regulator NrdR family protein
MLYCSECDAPTMQVQDGNKRDDGSIRERYECSKCGASGTLRYDAKTGRETHTGSLTSRV